MRGKRIVRPQPHRPRPVIRIDNLNNDLVFLFGIAHRIIQPILRRLLLLPLRVVGQLGDVAGIKLLVLIAGGRVDILGIKPDHVRRPLRTAKPREKRRIGCHHDNIGIALKVREESRLRERAL